MECAEGDAVNVKEAEVYKMETWSRSSLLEGVVYIEARRLQMIAEEFALKRV